MKPQPRIGMILIVTGLLLIALSLLVSRQFGWSDTLRGTVTGAAVGIELVGLIVMITGLSGKQA